MNNISDATLRKAASWWRSVIQNTQGEISTSALCKFEDVLFGLMVAQDKENLRRMVLRVDYDPEGILLEASEAASIPDAAFPNKTIMKIGFDSVVKTKVGYGSPWEVLSNDLHD